MGAAGGVGGGVNGSAASSPPPGTRLRGAEGVGVGAGGGGVVNAGRGRGAGAEGTGAGDGFGKIGLNGTDGGRPPGLLFGFGGEDNGKFGGGAAMPDKMVRSNYHLSILEIISRAKLQAVIR